MNRFKLHFSILALFIVAAIIVSGCKAPTVDYQISQFSTIRVMNFAGNCQAPMDVYWYAPGQTRPVQANVYDLGYGDASVYSNLLQAGNYNVLVTPHLILSSSDLQTSVTLAPNQKYSLIITRPSQSGPFNSTLITDGVPNPSQTLTYVRFINMQPNVGPLTVHVNDINTGEVINPVADSFGMVSPYVSLQIAEDTSYTFLVTNSSGQLITTLGYQTFVGGNSYTLVYAGDPCETLAQNPSEDTTKSAGNSLRLRTFDDNSLGNDLSYPVTQVFRFNIINDIVPNSSVGAATYYDANFPGDTALGFLVNGQALPEPPFYGFTIPPVPVYQGGGENVASYVNGALEVNYQSAIVPSPLVIQAFATSTSGSFQQQVFTAGGSAGLLSETSLVQASNNNKPWSIIFFDTVPKPWANLDTTAGPSHYALVPLPDLSIPNAATIVFISGVSPQNPNKGLPNNWSNFWLQAQGADTAIAAPGNSQNGLPTGKFDSFTIPLASSSAVFTVTDSIGQGTKTAPRVFGNSTQVTLQAGGIYEIVSEGTKANPHLLIMHVNEGQ